MYQDRNNKNNNYHHLYAVSHVVITFFLPGRSNPSKLAPQLGGDNDSSLLLREAGIVTMGSRNKTQKRKALNLVDGARLGGPPGPDNESSAKSDSADVPPSAALGVPKVPPSFAQAGLKPRKLRPGDAGPNVAPAVSTFGTPASASGPRMQIG